MAVYRGHVDAIRQLLRAKANPCLAARYQDDPAVAPLDAAATLGHSGVVQDFINQRLGSKAVEVHAASYKLLLLPPGRRIWTSCAR
ncbi:unnamed protein product [Ectocarpus fasciculatus]